MITRPRLVYFERWFDPVATEILDRANELTVSRLSYATPAAVSWASVAAAHGYQVQARTELREPWFVTADLLARSRALLAVSSAGAGHDVIDVEACTAAGVAVVNQSGSNSRSVAEHALGMILALSKRIPDGIRQLRQGRTGDRWQLVGHDVGGRTLGIVGLGHIGRRLAHIAAALDMRVLAYDPYLPEAEFAAMKTTAYFVDTARGGIHCEASLYNALVAGSLAGAGLDVFDDEPPAPDNPLLALDSVLATPHIAGVTVEAFRAMSEHAANQWLAIFAGRVPPQLVNPDAWPTTLTASPPLSGAARTR